MLLDLVQPKVNRVGMHTQPARRLFDVETAFGEGTDRAEQIVPWTLRLENLVRCLDSNR
jgi:hypothetical protein